MNGGYRKFDLLVSSMGMKSCCSQRGGPWIVGGGEQPLTPESCKKHPPTFNINPLSVHLWKGEKEKLERPKNHSSRLFADGAVSTVQPT